MTCTGSSGLSRVAAKVPYYSAGSVRAVDDPRQRVRPWHLGRSVSIDGEPCSASAVSVCGRQQRVPAITVNFFSLSVGTSVLVLIALLPHRLAGHDVAASQPAAEVFVGAGSATEGTVVLHGRLAADRAFRALRAFRPLRCVLPGSRLWGHSVSISARFGQK